MKSEKLKYSMILRMTSVIAIAVAACMTFTSCEKKAETISLKDESLKNLLILCDDLIAVQDFEEGSEDYGALFCQECQDYHTRAAEAVLPFAVAYKETGDEKYLKSAVSIGDWLVDQQNEDGSWVETPSTWTGTTADQALMMAVAYPILKDKLSPEQREQWYNSIKGCADWLVKNMNHEFASINYCATSTATLMACNLVVPDTAYVEKADSLAMLVTSKFDADYFLTGEGNRIRGTKYGVDLGYSLDMSLWGLGLYAKLRNNEFVDNYVKESLKRYVYFIYPDGSTDGSWGVRANKWTTYGSITADGCQILFSLYSQDDPIYRTAALENLKYLMSMRKDGLIGYGPHYFREYNRPPCIYPTFCRAKNLAMTIVWGDQSSGETPAIPTQEIGWGKYFKTMDLALVRTENFMCTVTGYRYKDIRRGPDFKYMHRPSGGSITNLWVKDYGYLEASSQTEYHRWEMPFPEEENPLSITPRIEFQDTNAYYTNLYEFDSHMELEKKNDHYVVEAIGELKDRARWEGGVAYVLTHEFYDDYIIKKIELRFHGQKPTVSIIEPIVENDDTHFQQVDKKTVDILGGKREFRIELLDDGYEFVLGEDEEKYLQPYPCLKGYPLTIKVTPDADSFLKTVSYKISIVD